MSTVNRNFLYKWYFWWGDLSPQLTLFTWDIAIISPTRTAFLANFDTVCLFLPHFLWAAPVSVRGVTPLSRGGLWGLWGLEGAVTKSQKMSRHYWQCHPTNIGSVCPWKFPLIFPKNSHRLVMVCCQNMHSRYAADLGNENNALQKCISFLPRIPFVLCTGPPQKLSNNVVRNKSFIGTEFKGDIIINQVFLVFKVPIWTNYKVLEHAW